MPGRHSALVIGASSGIGLELTRQLAAQDYRLGIAARRKNLLDQQATGLPQICCVRAMDISQPDEALKIFAGMLEEMAPIDHVFLSAGTGYVNPELNQEWEAETIRVNALGFAALAAHSWKFFLQQGHGHLTGITSVAAVRGTPPAPAYNATKSFCSSYLLSLRLRALESKLPIFVTEIRPGFVDTAMMKADRPFWVVTPKVAAHKILAAVARKKSVAYVPRRWFWLAWLLRRLPDRILAQMG